MEQDEKKLIIEHTQTMRELIQEFQKSYRVFNPILSEIPNSEIGKKLKAEREKIKNSNLND